MMLVISIVFFDPGTLKSEAQILPPPNGAEHFHFGFKETVSDVLWLSFIQNSFQCSKYKDPNKERCPNRWGYRTLKTASLLSPKFRALYEYGAVKLAVLLDDSDGAADLFETGLEEVGDSWIIAFRAAYLYLEELEDYNKAGELLEKTEKLGGPFWTRSLASRMYKKSGQLELSYSILEDLYESADEGPWKEDLLKRMQSIAQKLRSNSL